MTNQPGFLDNLSLETTPAQIEGTSLEQLATEYGTPLYVYSKGKFSGNIEKLQKAFKEALPADRQPLIAYACKTNNNITILTIAGKMGLGADIVSSEELYRTQQANIAPQKIVFSGVGKTDKELQEALKAGILQINVESAPEMDRIATLAEEMNMQAPIAFRLNPDVDAGTHAKITTGKSENKFGLHRDTIETLYKKADAHPHLHPRGLSIHIGSQITKLAPFRLAFEKLAEFALHLRSLGLSVESLDLGGGLGITYKDETPPCVEHYAEIVRDVILPLDTEIILEPGRFIAGEAGLLLARVLYVKKELNRQYVILDTGMNDLIRPALYDAHHTVIPLHGRTGNEVTYDIVGPVCETSDIFIKQGVFTELQRGDLVAITNAGAYGAVMASSFCARAIPAEVLVDGDRHAVIRKEQTVQDIIDKETIPEWA